ncbi:hypothetical protein SLS56_001222 [Neofusicoccum ribis]|uniref:Uncharacterized protein n=1 Tax=Neofusicoccum ribis TaxID=45134 RepID=A0ABR3TA55_9PEZI
MYCWMNGSMQLQIVVSCVEPATKLHSIPVLYAVAFLPMPRYPDPDFPTLSRNIISTTTPATNPKKPNQNAQHTYDCRFFFACSRASQDSLLLATRLANDGGCGGVCLEVTYEWSSFGRDLEDSEDCSDDPPALASSSRWMAAEKRFQNMGSRIVAILV